MSALTIGVDVGGTKISAGVVDDNGRILEESRHDTPATDVPAIRGAIAECIADLREEHSDIVAVGVAAAAFVDVTRSDVEFAPNLAWRDEPLRRHVEQAVRLPVVIENDANAAAWGEYRFGAGKDVDHMLLLTIGTGVGGGIIDQGHLLCGATGMAGEVGHIRVVPFGLRCGCGVRGCLEMYGSGSALVREAQEQAQLGRLQAERLLELAGGDPANISGQMVTQAASEGDTMSRDLLAELGNFIGIGAASLAAVLDPAMIVIGGGVSEAGDLLLEPVRAAFGQHLTGRGYRSVASIVQAELGNRAGIIGAADLAADVAVRRGMLSQHEVE